LRRFLVTGTGCALLDVAACNLFAKKLNFCTVLMDSAMAQYTVGTVHSWHSPTVDSDDNSTVSQKVPWHKFSEVLA